ncbi:glutamate-5-semialdehyde dehydrogenase [Chytriomyces confervae]|uniref:glutamate-5-semialdehyde dehydrogenase n=1 Tax=Chytriomyces confervae TaxID=246404 RepID=A0A507D673_9FUNG|nr:glutamate-5-semialdehyde dehydrogenase [Chytriomyces confervae]
MSDMEALATRSRAASLSLQTASCKDRNAALSLIHKALLENADKIQQENKADIEAATKLAESGALSQQLVKRLGLSGSKFADMVHGVKDIEMMDDPVGKTTLATRLDDGLDLYKVSCPIGVVLIIFEARPEVVVNIAALALKSGNAVILKGGKEAAKSNAILTSIINDALSQSKTISKDAVLLVESRTAIDELLKLDRYIDLVIPRGSNALVRHVQGSTRIPVLGHADGICATYLDEKLDPEMAIRVLIDAKTSAPSACNSTETLLIHESHISTPFFGSLVKKLTEAVKTVPNVSAAIAHINSHGSHHTDAIISSSKENAESFMRSVDSADTFWNCSTRFADGFRFGFGAEIGVSTNKTHARGPVGLEGMLIYKFRLYGNGQCTQDYGAGKKSYVHEKLEVDEAKFQI